MAATDKVIYLSNSQTPHTNNDKVAELQSVHSKPVYLDGDKAPYLVCESLDRAGRKAPTC